MPGRKIDFNEQARSNLEMQGIQVGDTIKSDENDLGEPSNQGPLIQNQYLNLSNYVCQNYPEDSTNEQSHMFNMSRPQSAIVNDPMNASSFNTVELL